MSTFASYTPLETLFLFRGIAKYFFDFEAISNELTQNNFLKNDAAYEPERLKAGRLEELFLDQLWEELKIEREAAPRPDAALSPTSKKRRLQPPPRPTLQDAIRYGEKIKSAYERISQIYREDAIRQVRDYELQHERVQSEIQALEKEEEQEQERERRRLAAESKAREDAARNAASGVNGVHPSQVPPPAPIDAPPQTSVSPPNTAQPEQQKPASLVPAPPQPAPERPTPTHPTPVLVQPQAVPSPRPLQPGIPQLPVTRPQDVARPQNGPSPVLQPPQGLPVFQPTGFAPPSQASVTQAPSGGLQQPEEVGRSKQVSPGPSASPQTAVQGQLRWEPPYQPTMPSPRPMGVVTQPQLGQGVIQPPQPLPPQRIPQLQAGQSGSRPLQPQPHPTKPASQPVLIPPQNTGQYAPPLQPSPAQPAAELVGQAQNRQQLQAPVVQQNRATPPVYQHSFPPPQGRPALPSPTPNVPTPAQRSHPGSIQQQQPRPPQNLQAPAPYSQPVPIPHSGPNHLGQPDLQRSYASPYQAPRSVIPDHLQQQQRLPSTPTPTPPVRLSIPSNPQTPASFGPLRLLTGSGTKWNSTSTPSTPIHRPSSRFANDVPESPSFEPLSPPLQPSHPLPAAAAPTVQQPAPSKPVVAMDPSVQTPPPKRKIGRPRASQRAQDAISPPKPTASPLSVPPLTIPSNGPSQASSANLLVPPGPSSSVSSPRASIENRPVDDVAQPENEPESAKIKDEVTTPRPLTETGDTTADESAAGPCQMPRSSKRKRDALSPTPVQTPIENQPFTPEPSGPSQSADAAPNKVLWTRHFNKVSGSAMEQIVHHRSANMFAAPIREKDAPGYHKVIRQPQDLKSIKAAINAGNRSAAQAAAALPGGDSNSSSVWLPCSDLLVPPKGIINSGQLDRELAHMFANAIMYNPDSGHGPGHTFLVRTNEEGGDEEGGVEGTLGYQVDEFGVVNDARAMSSEVEKLLSELRSAEVRRKNDGRTGAATGTSTRQASVAQREASQAGDETNTNADGDDEHTEAETGTTAKRRRTARG